MMNRHNRSIDSDQRPADELYHELEAGRVITVTDFVKREVEHWCDWGLGDFHDSRIWRNIDAKIQREEAKS